MVDEAKVARARSLREAGKTYREIQTVMKAEFGTEISTRILGEMPKVERKKPEKKSTGASKKSSKKSSKKKDDEQILPSL